MGTKSTGGKVKILWGGNREKGERWQGPHGMLSSLLCFLSLHFLSSLLFTVLTRNTPELSPPKRKYAWVPGIFKRNTPAVAKGAACGRQATGEVAKPVHEVWCLTEITRAMGYAPRKVLGSSQVPGTYEELRSVWDPAHIVLSLNARGGARGHTRSTRARASSRCELTAFSLCGTLDSWHAAPVDHRKFQLGGVHSAIHPRPNAAKPRSPVSPRRRSPIDPASISRAAARCAAPPRTCMFIITRGGGSVPTPRPPGHREAPSSRSPHGHRGWGFSYVQARSSRPIDRRA